MGQWEHRITGRHFSSGIHHSHSCGHNHQIKQKAIKQHARPENQLFAWTRFVQRYRSHGIHSDLEPEMFINNCQLLPDWHFKRVCGNKLFVRTEHSVPVFHWGGEIKTAFVLLPVSNCNPQEILQLGLHDCSNAFLFPGSLHQLEHSVKLGGVISMFLFHLLHSFNVAYELFLQENWHRRKQSFSKRDDLIITNQQQSV